MSSPVLFLGIDFGTTGCRAIVINDEHRIVARANVAVAPAIKENTRSAQDPEIWWAALLRCIRALGPQCDPKLITRLAISGTSATVLLCNANGKPLAPALMYNDGRAVHEWRQIADAAADDSGAIGASSSLAKVMWLLKNSPLSGMAHIHHQADWLSGKLIGQFGRCDYNNVLKLGFDSATASFPDWLQSVGIDRDWLPAVCAPGEGLGVIQPALADQLFLNPRTEIVAGTTDSIAAFLASGARQIGESVTSLGSTLVIKLLSDRPVYSAKHGVYSHRLGELWLVGGASNSGGSVLKKYFSDAEMTTLSELLRPDEATGLNYYPLTTPGERFPINDPDLQPNIQPIPGDKVKFFQALLEGISQIEHRGYKLLQELGAPSLTRVFTAGGGSGNSAWTKIRQNMLGVEVTTAQYNDAAYGSALLAAGGITHFSAGP